MTDKANCVVCKASRKRIVDSFLDGYIAGFTEAVASGAPEANFERPEFCLEHDKMVLEQHVRALRALTSVNQG